MKKSYSSGDCDWVAAVFVVSSRSKAALASRRPSPGHWEGPGNCRARLATTVRRRRRHTVTEVGQVTWRCVAQTISYQNRSLKDHSLTNWKPMKCRDDRRDVLMTTSVGCPSERQRRRLGTRNSAVAGIACHAYVTHKRVQQFRICETSLLSTVHHRPRPI